VALPKNISEYVLIAFACLLIGYGTGAVISARKNSLTLGETVAVKWSDGIHDTPAFCAHVYLDPYMTNNFRGHAARVIIFSGRDKYNQKFTSPHHLGLAKNQSEAIQKWGNLRWELDGLHVGEGNKSSFIPLSKIQSGWKQTQ